MKKLIIVITCALLSFSAFAKVTKLDASKIESIKPDIQKFFDEYIHLCTREYDPEVISVFKCDTIQDAEYASDSAVKNWYNIHRVYNDEVVDNEELYVVLVKTNKVSADGDILVYRTPYILTKKGLVTTFFQTY